MLPPLVVSVDTKRRSFVLDLPLALSPFGLLLTLRLAQYVNVWLARALWDILDNSRYFLSHRQMVPGIGPVDDGDGEAAADRLALALNQWQAARTDADLSGLKLYWTGDATKESMLPEDCDADLVGRFEFLAASLEEFERLAAAGCGRESAAFDHVRDTTALAVALMSRQPLVLTLADGAAGSGEPPYCKSLRALGIRCERIADAHRDVVMAEEWRELITRSGVIDLLWAGLDLVSVHLVAPNALVVGRDLPLLHASNSIDVSHVDVAQGMDGPWTGAAAFWYPVCGP